jgi:hypothetical protein
LASMRMQPWHPCACSLGTHAHAALASMRMPQLPAAWPRPATLPAHSHRCLHAQPCTDDWLSHCKPVTARVQWNTTKINTQYGKKGHS